MSQLLMTVTADADIPTPASGKKALYPSSDEGTWAEKDDAGVVTSLRGADGQIEYNNHGNTGATETIDWTADHVHRIVLDASCTLSFANVPATGTYAIVKLLVIQDATGGRTLTYPAAVTWGNAGTPVLQTAANGVDFLVFETVDGGTTVYGSQPGLPGQHGGAVSIDYLFSTTTTDADPGSGNLRLSNATQTSATAIRADLNDRRGTTWTAVIDSLDDSTNTVKGHIRLVKSDDSSKWLIFTVSAVGAESGYRNITVTNVAGSASSPFANGDPVTLHFTRTGDKGADGGAGTASFKRTVLNGGGNKTTTSTSLVAIDTTNLGYLTFDLEVGDVVRCALQGQITHSGAVAVSWDFEVDQPTSGDTRIGSGADYGCMKMTVDTNRHLLNVFGLFTATEAGVHGFRPMWSTDSGTLTLYNAASADGDTLVQFIAEHLGAPAA